MDIFVVLPWKHETENLVPQMKEVVTIAASAQDQSVEEWVQKAAEVWPDNIYFFVELVSPEL